jgi:hypothetical protein
MFLDEGMARCYGSQTSYPYGRPWRDVWQAQGYKKKDVLSYWEQAVWHGTTEPQIPKW